MSQEDDDGLRLQPPDRDFVVCVELTAQAPLSALQPEAGVAVGSKLQNAFVDSIVSLAISELKTCLSSLTGESSDSWSDNKIEQFFASYGNPGVSGPALLTAINTAALLNIASAMGPFGRATTVTTDGGVNVVFSNMEVGDKMSFAVKLLHPNTSPPPGTAPQIVAYTIEFT